jgi:4-hydroxy-tetrahydrodipicolinate synthase
MEPEELKEKIRGVLVAMTTPFSSDFELDEAGLRKQTRFLIESGIEKGKGGLVPTGTTGECPMLTDEERGRIFKIVVEETKGKAPVVAGCNHTDTRTVIKLAKYAKEAGADGLMISPPYYWAPSEEIILNHYKTICKETDLGIMVYNNWFATQVDISTETMSKLAELPNIVALKENTPYIEKFGKILDALGNKIVIFNGAGEPHEPHAFLMGAKGFVTGVANFIPKTLLEMYQAEREGEYVKAREIHRKITPLVDFIVGGESSADSVTRIKAAMKLVGIPAGPPRPPLIPLNEAYKKELKNLLTKIKLFDNYEL